VQTVAQNDRDIRIVLPIKASHFLPEPASKTDPELIKIFRPKTK
jgi:hypothetical protein